MQRQTIILTLTISLMAATLTMTVLLATNSILSSNKAEAQKTTASVTQVTVGGGNNTYPFFGYSPQLVQIKAGSGIVWRAPSFGSAPLEPHTITFVFNPKSMSGPDAPFAVPGSTQFVPLPQGANSKPNVVTGGKDGMNTVIINNAMSFLPAIVDAAGNAKTFPKMEI